MDECLFEPRVLRERERRAYIEGDLPMAAALALILEVSSVALTEHDIDVVEEEAYDRGHRDGVYDSKTDSYDEGYQAGLAAGVSRGQGC